MLLFCFQNYVVEVSVVIIKKSRIVSVWGAPHLVRQNEEQQRRVAWGWKGRRRDSVARLLLVHNNNANSGNNVQHCTALHNNAKCTTFHYSLVHHNARIANSSHNAAWLPQHITMQHCLNIFPLWINQLLSLNQPCAALNCSKLICWRDWARFPGQGMGPPDTSWIDLKSESFITSLGNTS